MKENWLVLMSLDPPAKSRDLAVGRPVTRSKTSPYNRDVWFFWRRRCRFRHTLHKVSTFSAGESLRAALGMPGNDKLSVRFSSQTFYASRHQQMILVVRLTSEIAAKNEFLTMTEKTLKEGKIATMSELQASFEIVLGANNVADPTYNRKALKQLPDEVHKRAMSLAQSTFSMCLTPEPN